VIVQALYGLKSSGTAWHAHLAQSFVDMGYKSSYTDAEGVDVQCNKIQCFKYYDEVLVYVDDILVVLENLHTVNDFTPIIFANWGHVPNWGH